MALDNDMFESGSVIFQYNYTHDNDGGFFNDGMSQNAYPDMGCTGTIWRYNISKNDYLKGAGKTWDLGFGRELTQMYNNVVYKTKCDSGYFRDSINWYYENLNFFFDTTAGRNVSINNNIFFGVEGMWYSLGSGSLYDRNLTILTLLSGTDLSNTWSHSNTIFNTNCYYNLVTNGYASVTLPYDPVKLTNNPSFYDTSVLGGSDGLKLNPGSYLYQNTSLTIPYNGALDFFGNYLNESTPVIGAYQRNLFFPQGPLAVAQNSDSTVSCFARDITNPVANTIFYRKQTYKNSTDFGPLWTRIFVTGSAMGEIAVGKNNEGRSFMFWPSRDTLEYVYQVNPNGTWGNQPFKIFVSVDSSSQIATASIGINPKQQLVLVRSSSQLLYYSIQKSSATGFDSLKPVPPMSSISIGNKIVAARNPGTGSVDIFVNNSQNNILRVRMNADGTWATPYKDLGGAIVGEIAIGTNESVGKVPCLISKPIIYEKSRREPQRNMN